MNRFFDEDNPRCRYILTVHTLAQALEVSHLISVVVAVVVVFFSSSSSVSEPNK